MQKLTAAFVKQAKPREKAFSLVDGGGLYCGQTSQKRSNTLSSSLAKQHCDVYPSVFITLFKFKFICFMN